MQPYPGPGAKRVVSTNGGEEPVWSPDGRELFYRTGDSMMTVSIETRPAFTSGPPRSLFEWRFIQTTPSNLYDVSPDGKQFLMIRRDRNRLVELNVVLNWAEELKRLVPTNN